MFLNPEFEINYILVPQNKKYFYLSTFVNIFFKSLNNKFEKLKS